MNSIERCKLRFQLFFPQVLIDSFAQCEKRNHSYTGNPNIECSYVDACSCISWCTWLRTYFFLRFNVEKERDVISLSTSPEHLSELVQA